MGETSNALLTLTAIILVGGSINFFIVNRRYPAAIQRGLSLYAYANLAVAASNMFTVITGNWQLQPVQFVSVSLSAVGTCLYYFAYRSIQERPFHLRVVAPLYGLTVIGIAFGTLDQGNVNIAISSICVLDIILFTMTSRDLFLNFTGRGRAHITQGVGMALFVLVLLLWVIQLLGAEPQARLVVHVGKAEAFALGATCIAAALGAVNFLLICNDEFNTRLQNLIGTDPLTGVANRRKLVERGEEEIVRLQRFKQPLTMVMIDLDHFKKINDTYGHAAGDRVLKEAAQACVNALRDIDVVARSGGEEFAVLLPQTPLHRALEVAERLRVAMAGIEVLSTGTKIAITASLGVAEFGENDTSLDQLMARADRALYRSKADGRNRVTHELTDSGLTAIVKAPA